MQQHAGTFDFIISAAAGVGSSCSFAPLTWHKVFLGAMCQGIKRTIDVLDRTWRRACLDHDNEAGRPKAAGWSCLAAEARYSDLRDLGSIMICLGGNERTQLFLAWRHTGFSVRNRV